MSSKHAFLSASGAPAWTRCEIKPWREKDIQEQTSVYAEEGIKAHELLERAIANGGVGGILGYPEEMYENVNKTLAIVFPREYGKTIYAEQKLDISSLTGEHGAEGTADVIIVTNDRIDIIDLKYGMGVEVNAEENEQLLIYGAAAIEKYDVTGDIKTLRMVISQPRLDHISEWILPLSEVRSRLKSIKVKAKRILASKGGDNLHATPGEKQCQFCKVKGTCPEYRGFALATVTDDFVDLDKEEQFLAKVRSAEKRLSVSDDRHLATCMDAVAMIESWCAAVHKEVEKRLFERRFTDPRWKLVQGKRGHRKFINTEEISGILPDDDNLWEPKKLKSPAQLEKILKQSPEVWDKLQDFLIQSEGRPILAPVTDKRPAISEIIDFEPIESEFIDALVGLTKENS